ncbi:hypothetical protein FOA52_006022 [Chlamydomonas sp. UWO 241]|nr:hypothetical protein FOA52_006022 [Chlamydomonas sp. UWO 241]
MALSKQLPYVGASSNCPAHSKTQSTRKYDQASARIAYLRSKGASVLFSMDATQLGTGSGPLGSGCSTRFDLISFYFPHTSDSQNNAYAVYYNRRRFKDFLATAPRLLNPTGTIELAVMRGVSYNLWRVWELLTEQDGFFVVQVYTLSHASQGTITA